MDAFTIGLMGAAGALILLRRRRSQPHGTPGASVTDLGTEWLTEGTASTTPAGSSSTGSSSSGGSSSRATDAQRTLQQALRDYLQVRNLLGIPSNFTTAGLSDGIVGARTRSALAAVFADMREANARASAAGWIASDLGAQSINVLARRQRAMAQGFILSATPSDANYLAVAGDVAAMVTCPGLFLALYKAKTGRDPDSGLVNNVVARCASFRRQWFP